MINLINTSAPKSYRCFVRAWSIAFHFMYYNFVKIHKTLKCSPAMAAGVTDKLWEMTDVVAMIEAEEEKPAQKSADHIRKRKITMANFRVETVVDKKTGLVFAELYYPNDALEPIACTQPVYPTHEQAIADAVKMMKEAFPGQPIT